MKNQKFLISNFSRKLVLIMTFLLFSTSVLAQNFNIRVITYDPETQNARIQIQNTASTDFNDLKMKIDDIVKKDLAPFVKAGSSFSIFLTVTPGEHTITLTTKEGITETRKLYFSPSEEQLKESLEKQKQLAEQQKRIKAETEKPLEIPETKKFDFRYLYILIGLIALIIIYLLYKKFKK